MSEEFNFYSAFKSGLSFQDQRFINMEVSDLDISCGDFIEIEIYNSVFRRCSFVDTDFSYAEFNGCLFRGCDLSGTMFEGIAGNNMSFIECQMDNVSFRNTEIDDLSFIGCEGRLSFKEAIIREAHFNDCTFKGTTFCGADLTGVIIMSCDLTNAVFDQNTQLAKVTFDRTTITDAPMKNVLGLGTVDFRDVIVLPYAEKKTLKNPQSSVRTKRLTTTEAYTSIYGGKNLIAHLYCADQKEFRRTG